MNTTTHILLATYQGAEHLPKQLHSIEQQTFCHWHLWARDDGSTDATRNILQAFAHRHPDRTTLLEGQGGGAARNFWALLQAVQPRTDHDLFAFCDQDDVWLSDKLERAVHWHTHQSGSATANLYCARTQVTDAQLRPLYLSPRPRRPLTLCNALVENIASGNTMVLNVPLLQAMKRIAADNMVLHDWSAYLAATACGGKVHFDPHPCLLYRQHSANVVGARKGLLQRAQRLGRLMKGGYRAWGDATEGALRDLAPLLTAESKGIARSFAAARHSTCGVQRLNHALRTGLARQRRSAQWAFWLAVLLGLV